MRTRLVLVLVVLVLGVAACGDGGDDPVVDDTSPTPTPEATATATGAEEGTGDEAEGGQEEAGAEVSVESSDLGEILVDEEGMTLYVFLPDEAGEPTCTDDCLEAWPLLEGPASAGEGVDESMLDTAEHPSGDTQATYNGWPLYYFANDMEAGDVNGQGVGDNWYVVSPEGEPVQDAAALHEVAPGRS